MKIHPSMMPEARVPFVCLHVKGWTDQPPETINVFIDPISGSGNAREELLRDSEEAIDAFPIDRGPGHNTPTSGQLTRLIDEHSDLERAVRTRFHYQLRCRTCRFTERISPDDLTLLNRWAEHEGWTEIPLVSARRKILPRARTEFESNTLWRTRRPEPGE